MLGENLKILRKQKGLSQETLAQQLNVVRQTVSKWEKGLSVPDAEMLNTISELFEVPVSTLLGSTVEEPEKTSDSAMEEIAKQLAILNEQLATRSVRRRKTAKKVLTGIVIAIAAVIVLLVTVMLIYAYKPEKDLVLTTKNIECVMDGEVYHYYITYDQKNRVRSFGGDNWTDNMDRFRNYDDADEMIGDLEEYLIGQGYSFKIVES
ncbi:MAG: helix-turn-helix transcriptional regulator [Clostridiales bacterium]|nr:helix-turn-helix transcriptional regulator [Clostridiales bacterium]